MALKALMLRKKIDDAKKRMDALKAKGEEFERRSSELETAIGEASTPEEQQTVEEAVQQYDTERTAYDGEVSALEAEISGLEQELAQVERANEPIPAPAPSLSGEPAPRPAPSVETRTEIRKDERKMNHRSKIMASIARRTGMMEREDVQTFISTVRESITNTRAITNAGLLIPTVVMDILQENVIDYSKLYRHVNAQYVPGNTRIPVMAKVPEAVWTEMCAAINELTLGFGVVETDGYKVAGYFALCNAIAEDADDELIVSVVDALGQSIGLALDKAILYGTGIKMPLGIVTRLVQTTQPADYPDTAPVWENLSASNVLSIAAADSTGVKLYQALVRNMGAAKGKYSRGEKFWVMNETTYTNLIAEGLSINANGAIVAAIDGTMPVVGGVVEILSFVPDNIIIGGYGDLYFLAERQGTRITSSEHALFIQDQTVYKGVARYDGKPVIASAFVVIGINGTTPNATMEFAPDTANTPAVAAASKK